MSLPSMVLKCEACCRQPSVSPIDVTEGPVIAKIDVVAMFQKVPKVD